MIVKGHMFAFGKPDDPTREIEIPDECVTLKDRLMAAYENGQNEFQPRRGPSVSVGDVIEIESAYYIVRGCGFDLLTQEDFEIEKAEAGLHPEKWLLGPTQGEL